LKKLLKFKNNCDKITQVGRPGFPDWMVKGVPYK